MLLNNRPVFRIFLLVYFGQSKRTFPPTEKLYSAKSVWIFQLNLLVRPHFHFLNASDFNSMRHVISWSMPISSVERKHTSRTIRKTKEALSIVSRKNKTKQKRARGRPKKNWMEGIKKAMNERSLNEGKWEDRKQWNLGVGQCRKTFWTRYIHTRMI